MNYFQWEYWFSKLGVEASLRQLDINQRSIESWRNDFEHGLSPSDSLKALLSDTQNGKPVGAEEKYDKQ